MNRRAGSFLTQYLKFLGQRHIWELLMKGDVFISGSSIQRILDVSPCFGSAFSNFHESDLDVYCLSDKTYFELQQEFEGSIIPGAAPSESYDQSYGENFYVEMIHENRTYKCNVILSHVRPTPEETVENYDLRYLSVFFSAGLILPINPRIGVLNVVCEEAFLTGLPICKGLAGDYVNRDRCHKCMISLGLTGRLEPSFSFC
jgi:hypothetical protein